MPIALHDIFTLDDELSCCAVRDIIAVLIDDADFDARKRQTNRAGLDLGRGIDSYDGRGLRQAVSFDNG
jgi:hypothetical protein